MFSNLAPLPPYSVALFIYLLRLDNYYPQLPKDVFVNVYACAIVFMCVSLADSMDEILIAAATLTQPLLTASLSQLVY